MSKKLKKNKKKNPYFKMIMVGLLCVLIIAVLAFYICAQMVGDSIYYLLDCRYDKSAAYEDKAHDLILHSRTHKPFTGVIVLDDKKDDSTAPFNTDNVQESINPYAYLSSQKEIFIKNGQIRGEKIYNMQTGKLCQETFFEFDGHFKYRRSYGPDCSYLEAEEIFKKNANVVLFYNAKGQKTVKAFIENDRFTHGFCYEGLGQTIPLNAEQLERLNYWDTTVTCRD